MGNNANQEGVKFDTLLERKYVKMPHSQLAPFYAQISASNLHRQRIAQSMREHGWKGLPLLVHNCKDGSYQAWMGMHRLLAASDAELTQIPVVLVTREQLYEAG